MLPLEDCDVSSCTCRYRHYDDRRDRLRRSDDLGERGKRYAGEDRRMLPERRMIKRARGQDYFEYSAGEYSAGD